MHLQWFSQHSFVFNLIVAYIPLVATVTTTILSIVLARATLRYAEASDKSLALAREEFERQWSPELHIKLEKTSSRQARIVVTNLAKISVLLQMVQLRRLAMGVPSLRTILNEPLRLEPVNIAARRVRMLDGAGQETEELAQDVVKASAAHA